MRVLLDECLPGRKLKLALAAHDVRTVADMDWRGIKNGTLLARAAPLFDAFVTVDANLPHQQNTPALNLPIVVLRARSNRLEHLLPLITEAAAALDRGQPGEGILVPVR